MTREQAVKECKRLSAEKPDALWLPQEQESGEWSVVEAQVEGLPTARNKFTAEVQPSPGPPRPSEDVPPQPRWLPWGFP